MTTKAQLEAQTRYDKNHTKQLALKLNSSTDSDILAKLELVDNKQGYIKSLIRDDMRYSEDILSLESIRCLLLPVVRKFDIRRLGVFGSYARNEATSSSDVDILIEGGNYHGLFEYMSIIEAMKQALGKNVDLVTQSSLDQNKSASAKQFKSNLERDLKVLI